MHEFSKNANAFWAFRREKLSVNVARGIISSCVKREMKKVPLNF